MSINNSTRSIAHVSVTSALLGLNNSQYKRSVEQVESKVHAYRKAEHIVQGSSKKTEQETVHSYSSVAHEIYSSVSNTFNELAHLAQHRLNPLAFVNSNATPVSESNNVDLKRHQYYFNQMMSFDSPSGSWIDISS